MPTTTIDTWLPVFPGFYNTLFDISEQEYRWVESLREQQLVPDDWRLDFDYAAFTKAVSEQACKWVAREFKTDLSKFGIVSVEFQSLHSPREYNFTNDTINVRVTIDTEAFAKAFGEYLAEDGTLEVFRKYLVRHYQSRSGFSSFYPFTVEGWAEATTNWSFSSSVELPDELSNGCHSLGRLMEFILEREEANPVEPMYWFVSERVYLDEFVTNYPENFDHSLANERESFTL